MKRKESVIGGLDRILSAHQASALLGIPAEDLLPYYSAQNAMSLRNLLKKICRSNPVYHFPIIGETTYTLKGVMSAIGKGRSWTLEFLERHNVQNWCLGVHYLHSKADVDLEPFCVHRATVGREEGPFPEPPAASDCCHRRSYIPAAVPLCP